MLSMEYIVTALYLFVDMQALSFAIIYYILPQSYNAILFYFGNIFVRTHALIQLSRLNVGIETFFGFNNMSQVV